MYARKIAMHGAKPNKMGKKGVTRIQAERFDMLAHTLIHVCKVEKTRRLGIILSKILLWPFQIMMSTKGL